MALTDVFKVFKSPGFSRCRLRIQRWLLYEVCFALLPFILNLAGGYMDGSPKSYGSLIGRGELLLVSGAICAAGTGELVSKITRNGVASAQNKLQGVKTSLIAFNSLLIAATSWFFASIAGKVQDAVAAKEVLTNSVVDLDRVANASIAIFIAAMLTSIGCLIVAEVS